MWLSLYSPLCLLSAHRKSFIETRSIGAVAVAFSRVYMLHSILLCWMSLLVGAAITCRCTALSYASCL
jgi:hypothetical protein